MSSKLKAEETEILAPTIRKPNLPCAVDRTCLNAYCKKRVYTLSEAQIKLLTSAQEQTDDEVVPDICDVQKCRKRLYPKFIKLSFCIKAKCKYLNLPRLQCNLKPKKHRLDLGRHETTLRARWKAGGWYYRKVK